MPNKSNRLSTLISFCSAIFAICTCKLATAQIRAPDFLPNAPSTALLQQYKESHEGTINGQEILIGILNKGLAPNDNNLQIVRSELAKNKAPDEKILLTKLLASLHTPGIRSQQNLTIERDLKSLILSANERIATEATFEYSRLVYPPDRYQVLSQARAAKILDEDSYFGELAHGLRFAPSSEQSQMLAEIEKANNRYADGILASTFNNQVSTAQLNRSVQSQLLRLLSTHEPHFPMMLDSFGFVDIIRYAIWLDAVATVESGLSGKAHAGIVLAKLYDQRTDPRKILAVFASPEGIRVINETKDVKQLQQLLTRTRAYSNSLPQNAMLRDATALFDSRLRSRITHASTALTH
ncbi:MAG: hypothetical protein ACRYF7_02395 [Janthinobacterium lividum]